MQLRNTTLALLSILVLGLGYASTAADKDNGFDSLDDFKKDFLVAAGDAKSWKVNGKVFECTGKPNGYICTKKSYSNYVLTYEFRFPKNAGNSGALNYITGKHKVWPACVEVQGHYDNLAQIFAMGGAKGPRSNGNADARKKARKPHTEWNKFEITSKNGVLTAKLNGVQLNKSGPYVVRKGQIGFQSEGAPIHFRNFRIKEL